MSLEVGDIVDLGDFDAATQHTVDFWKDRFFDPLGLRRHGLSPDDGINTWDCPQCDEADSVHGRPSILTCKGCGLMLEVDHPCVRGYPMVVVQLGQLTRLQILSEEE